MARFKILSKLCFVFLLSCLILYILILNWDPKWSVDMGFSQYISKKNQSVFDPLANETCVLPNLEPWDPSLRKYKYLDPKLDSYANCVPKFEIRSYIDLQGVLHINSSEYEEFPNEVCFYACSRSPDDRNAEFGNWTLVDPLEETIPACDTVEVLCEANGNATYRYLHMQIDELPPNPEPKPQFYDVHIILLDAVSMSHAHRALPQTFHFLQSQMDSIDFHYLNKVGHNSRPNAYAFLMGKQPEQLFRKDDGPSDEIKKDGRPPDQLNELCSKPIENDTVITDFQKSGYRTMFFEDWTMGAFRVSRNQLLVDEKVDQKIS